MDSKGGNDSFVASHAFRSKISYCCLMILASERWHRVHMLFPVCFATALFVKVPCPNFEKGEPAQLAWVASYPGCPFENKNSC